MPAPHAQYGFNEEQKAGQFPIKIVGGNNFGRYPKISQEQTWNLIVSDNFLVPYAGYKNVLSTNSTGVGRGLYSSTIGGLMLAVIGSAVYAITQTADMFVYQQVGNVFTTVGPVFMDENNSQQIAFTDGVYVYVYNYSSGLFSSSAPFAPNTFTFPFQNPGFISFQNGRLIIACDGTQTWALSAFNDALTWTNTSSTTGTIQSKPCFIQAAVPLPGGGNNIIVFGTNVAESWQDLGLALFPYQRNASFNIDYGCINASSIASLENFIVWISYNESSGPSLSYMQGSQVKRISTDGIDFKLSSLTNPSNCLGFLFRQDGHIIYQFTFVEDNLTYAYDFNTSLFFTISDDDLNYHIARQVVFFNNQYYFVSLNDANLYQFGTQFTNADYGNGIVNQLPRIRVTPPMRLPDQRYYIGKSVGFTIEQGQLNNALLISQIPEENPLLITTESNIFITTESGSFISAESEPAIEFDYTLLSEAVDISISRDGGYSFGSAQRLSMNPTGQRLSRFIYQRLGIVNDMTFQFRFSGFGRFVCTDGIVEVYQ